MSILLALRDVCPLVAFTFGVVLFFRTTIQRKSKSCYDGPVKAQVKAMFCISVAWFFCGLSAVLVLGWLNSPEGWHPFSATGTLLLRFLEGIGAVCD